MDEETVAPSENKRRPKRKKQNTRFRRNAKGFAKKGIYGRGTHIEDDEYSYFINILDALKTPFEEVDEKVALANNVFENTKEKELHLASNQIVCKVLESLIAFVDDEHLERFFHAFAENFRPICSDRFASHVVQKMVEIAFLRGIGKDHLKATEDTAEPARKRAKPQVDMFNEETYNLDTTFTEAHRENCRGFVVRLSKFLLNNLEDFVWDACANHIMRTCILSLTGVHVPKVAFEKGGAAMVKNHKLYTVPDDWIELMKEYPQRLEMWPQFVEFPYQSHSSALLSVICIALRTVDKTALKHLGKRILMESFLKVDAPDTKKDEKIEILDDEEQETPEEPAEKETADDTNTQHVQLPKVFQEQSSIVLLETLLTIAGSKLLTQLYAMLFAGRVAQLAQDQATNFAVQKLLLNLKEKEDFENVFGELAEHTGALLKVGYTGVVEAMAAACLRLATKQSQMIVALQSALDVAGDKEKGKWFFQCLVKLKPHDIVQQDKSSFVHLHGSLIVQHILGFNKPIFLVTCLLETPADQLTSIFNTPNGSHIVLAFLQSKFIGEKSREKLLRHLSGFYSDLAVTKFGSLVVENCFEFAPDQSKERIVKELSEKLNLLKATPFGKLLNTKLRVDVFRLSPDQWRTGLQRLENKAEKLFEDIIK